MAWRRRRGSGGKRGGWERRCRRRGKECKEGKEERWCRGNGKSDKRVKAGRMCQEAGWPLGLTFIVLFVQFYFHFNHFFTCADLKLFCTCWGSKGWETMTRDLKSFCAVHVSAHYCFATNLNQNARLSQSTGKNHNDVRTEGQRLKPSYSDLLKSFVCVTHSVHTHTHTQGSATLTQTCSDWPRSALNSPPWRESFSFSEKPRRCQFGNSVPDRRDGSGGDWKCLLGMISLNHLITYITAAACSAVYASACVSADAHVSVSNLFLYVSLCVCVCAQKRRVTTGCEVCMCLKIWCLK